VITRFRARSLLLEDLADQPPALGRYLSQFIRENLLLHERLSRTWREERIESIWVADAYEPGQLIVRRGQEMTPPIRRALQMLHDKTGLERLRSNQTRHQAEARAAWSMMRLESDASQSELDTLRRYVTWSLVGLSLVLVILAFRLGWRQRHPKWPPQAVAAITGGTGTLLATPVVTCPSCDADVPVRVVDGLAQSVKDRPSRGRLTAGLYDELRRWAKSKLMRRLVSQRDALEQNQALAEHEIKELTERLAAVQAPMLDRLRAYEERIGALEKELEAKGEENRALIDAKLAALRKQLELERGSGTQTLSWN
jgi:hypothetical protein